TDSIVAEDVGSFPDRNVNEAISRVPGVALGRNDYGEGESVAIRGNGPNLTRVELDGIGVQSTNGLAISAAGGRSADLRELPADLIRSVDIVKGTTADMVEGSLGGSILIETRTGLDFEQPYFSLRLGGQQNTLSEEWSPDGNFVAAGQFLDGRLGVIASATINNIQTNAHAIENTISGNRGYARLFDFDQSPEKTFTFNPSTVGTDAADVLLANSIYTPRTLVTRAAGAQSKSECFTLFPHNPAGTAVQRQARILEQQTCLNQWNDYTPSLIREFMNSQEDERTSYDIRFDYRVADSLTVYAKFNENNRLVNDQNRSRQQVGGIQQNAAGTSLISTTGYPRTRSVSPSAPAGYFLWDPSFGLDDTGNAAAAGPAGADNAVLGNVLNVVPGSVTVDADHNVTQMSLTNQSVNIDQISNITDIQTTYMQFGGDYERDRVEINFMAGRTDTISSRTDLRTSRGYQYGNATITLQPNSHWNVDLPAGYDDTNPANFVQLRTPVCVNGVGTPPTCTGQAAVAATINNPASPLYTVGQMPLTTPNFSVSFSPFLAESSEEIVRLDFSYSTDGILPFISGIKTGLMHRERLIDRWGGGGYTA
ncbi:MAG: TonB-dependent receptor plug domain-containing protein, partial [Burkholderiales bacterium]|nr:TonB-dependent receptor plug domain-containing protein [Phycisphaerae bacterium]